MYGMKIALFRGMEKDIGMLRIVEISRIIVMVYHKQGRAAAEALIAEAHNILYKKREQKESKENKQKKT